MSLFESQTCKIESNEIRHIEGTRQPVSGYFEIADRVPCRLTGTNEGNMKLFVLKKHYDKIAGGIHKNYKITISEILNPYTVVKEPMWAGGKYFHHIELELEVYK